MGKEFELKFTARPEQQAKILEEYGGFAAVSMETTYFDTPDGSLSQRRITLRRRMENGVSVCTVKTPAGGLTRGEWEIQCDDIHRAIPELCKLGCPAEIYHMTRSGLVEVCGARFTRMVKRISLEAGAVELALDRGILVGGGREIPLCEAEVELKAGTEETAERFALTLAEKYGLVPEGKGKFQRALALAREE